MEKKLRNGMTPTQFYVLTVLLRLSGESTVEMDLLTEDETLVGMILANVDYAQLLDYVNENY